MIDAAVSAAIAPLKDELKILKHKYLKQSSELKQFRAEMNVVQEEMEGVQEDLDLLARSSVTVCEKWYKELTEYDKDKIAPVSLIVRASTAMAKKLDRMEKEEEQIKEQTAKVLEKKNVGEQSGVPQRERLAQQRHIAEAKAYTEPKHGLAPKGLAGPKQSHIPRRPAA
jgi:hypothetical protein